MVWSEYPTTTSGKKVDIVFKAFRFAEEGGAGYLATQCKIERDLLPVEATVATASCTSLSCAPPIEKIRGLPVKAAFFNSGRCVVSELAILNIPTCRSRISTPFSSKTLAKRIRPLLCAYAAKSGIHHPGNSVFFQT